MKGIYREYGLNINQAMSKFPLPIAVQLLSKSIERDYLLQSSVKRLALIIYFCKYR